MKSTFVLLCILVPFLSIQAQRNGDFRSTGTVRLNAAANWQTYSGGSWNNATQAPSSASLNNNNTITVRTGHTWSNTANVVMPNTNFIFEMESTSTSFTAGTTINWRNSSTVVFENAGGTVSYSIANQAFNNLTIRRNGGSGNFVAAFDGSGSLIVNRTLDVQTNTELRLVNSTMNLAGNNKTFITNGTLSLQPGTINVTGNSVTLETNGPVNLDNGTINFNGNNGSLEMNDELNFLNPSTSSSYIKLLANNGRFYYNGTISGASPQNYIQLGETSTASRTYGFFETAISFPIGTSNYYLPASVGRPLFTWPTLTVGVYEGVTENGLNNGTEFTPAKKINLVDATWRIASSSNMTPTAIDLGWQPPLEGNSFASLTGNIGISYYNTGASEWTTSFGSGNGLLNIVNRSTSLPSIGSSGMSFGVGIIGVVLPVKLHDFKAAAQNSGIRLSWVATSEEGDDHFEVERSASLNGIYEKIGLVKSEGGGERKYLFEDRQPLREGYYRIRTVHANQLSTQSESLKVMLASKAFSLDKLYPTISQGELYLQISSPATESVHLEIADMNGLIVMQQQQQVNSGTSNYTLQTAHLRKGTYVLMIKKAGSVISGRFIRQ